MKRKWLFSCSITTKIKSLEPPFMLGTSTEKKINRDMEMNRKLYVTFSMKDFLIPDGENRYKKLYRTICF